jgi:hypothetical protein
MPPATPIRLRGCFATRAQRCSRLHRQVSRCDHACVVAFRTPVGTAIRYCRACSAVVQLSATGTQHCKGRKLTRCCCARALDTLTFLCAGMPTELPTAIGAHRVISRLAVLWGYTNRCSTGNKPPYVPSPSRPVPSLPLSDAHSMVSPGSRRGAACRTFDPPGLAGEVSSIAVGPWRWSCTASCAGSTCTLSAGTTDPIARTLVRVTMGCSSDPCYLPLSTLRCDQFVPVLNGTLPASIGNLACRSKITSMYSRPLRRPLL